MDLETAGDSRSCEPSIHSSRACTYDVIAKRKLEADYDACGISELILGFGVEMGEQVIDLYWAHGKKRQHLEIQAAAECGGETVLCRTGSDNRA